MSCWVEVPLIKGARFVTIKDPQVKPHSIIEIPRATADAKAAKVTRRETGKFTVEFAAGCAEAQTLRYAVRNPTRPA